MINIELSYVDNAYVEPSSSTKLVYAEPRIPTSDVLNTVDTRLGDLILVMFMMDNPGLDVIPAYVAVPIWNVLTCFIDAKLLRPSRDPAEDTSKIPVYEIGGKSSTMTFRVIF